MLRLIGQEPSYERELHSTDSFILCSDFSSRRLIENTSLKATFFPPEYFSPHLLVLGFCSKRHVSTFYNLPFAHTQTSLNDQVTYRSLIDCIIAVVVFQTILSYSGASLLREQVKPEWPLKRSDPRASSLWKSDCEGKRCKDRWSLGLVLTEVQGWSLGLVFTEI